MTDRILDLSSSAGFLKIHFNQLILEQKGKTHLSIPLDDLCSVIVSHHSVILTQPALATLTQNNIPLIVCDRKHLPVGALLPLQYHSLQSERLKFQVEAKKSLLKNLWMQIVKSKIKNQGRVLEFIQGHNFGFKRLSCNVRSGDPQNIEARAARKYWPLIFNDENFRRSREGVDQNRHLNYGYAILRAMVSRAICGAGLTPTLGIHHRNRYNPFCLADDLMEPLRPLVDQSVASYLKKTGNTHFEKEAKKHILETLLGRIVFQNESRTLFDICCKMAFSLVEVFKGESKKLLLPSL
jgi:CRISPR-associated protein Cas1